MDDAMYTRQTAADCFLTVGVDVRPAQGAPWTVEEHCDRGGTAGRHPVAAVGDRSSADVAAWRVREGHDYPAEQFDPVWKLAYMWEHPFHFPLATWTALREWGAPLWPELIGILGWQDIVLRPLDLYRAHGPPPACPAAKTAAGWTACARGDRDRICRPQLLCVGLSDFFPHLHACRFAPCLRCSRTLLRHRSAHGCDLRGLADQPRITARRARAGRDYRLNDCGSDVRGRGTESALVMWAMGLNASTRPLVRFGSIPFLPGPKGLASVTSSSRKQPLLPLGSPFERLVVLFDERSKIGMEHRNHPPSCYPYPPMLCVEQAKVLGQVETLRNLTELSPTHPAPIAPPTLAGICPLPQSPPWAITRAMALIAHRPHRNLRGLRIPSLLAVDGNAVLQIRLSRIVALEMDFIE